MGPPRVPPKREEKKPGGVRVRRPRKKTSKVKTNDATVIVNGRHRPVLADHGDAGKELRPTKADETTPSFMIGP